MSGMPTRACGGLSNPYLKTGNGGKAQDKMRNSLALQLAKMGKYVNLAKHEIRDTPHIDLKEVYPDQHAHPFRPSAKALRR